MIFQIYSFSYNCKKIKMGTTSSSTSSDSGTLSYDSSGDTNSGTFQYGIDNQGTQCCPCSTPYVDANDPYINGGVPATYTGNVEHFKVDSKKEKFHLFVLIVLLILFGLFLYHSK
jgi:hypothetical protein